MQEAGYDVLVIWFICSRRETVRRTSVGKPQKKVGILRQRKGLKNNIKMDLREMGCKLREIHGTWLRTDFTESVNISEFVACG
jgi:hypothetical protein